MISSYATPTNDSVSSDLSLIITDDDLKIPNHGLNNKDWASLQSSILKDDRLLPDHDFPNPYVGLIIIDQVVPSNVDPVIEQLSLSTLG